MKKRIISIVLIFFAIGFVATAQPPKPPIGNNIDTRNASKGILGGKTGTVSVREKAVKLLLLLNKIKVLLEQQQHFYLHLVHVQ